MILTVAAKGLFNKETGVLFAIVECVCVCEFQLQKN